MITDDTTHSGLKYLVTSWTTAYLQCCSILETIV